MPATAQPDHTALIAAIGADEVVKQTGKAGEEGGVRLVVSEATVAHAHPTREGLRLWIPAVGFNARGLEVKELKKGASSVTVRTAAEARKAGSILKEVAKSKAQAKKDKPAPAAQPAQRTTRQGQRTPSRARQLVEQGLAEDVTDATAQLADMGAATS